VLATRCGFLSRFPKRIATELFSQPGGIKRLYRTLFKSTVNTSEEFVVGLATAHGEELQRFLRTRVRNASDIPDIVQEVFLRMLRIPTPAAIRSPEAYLFTVAQHVAQQYSLRQSTSAPSIEADAFITEFPATLDADPMAQAHAEQCVDELGKAFERLTPKIRATFILHRHHGLSLEEISQRLGITFPMAKKYLVKALILVRQHLQEQG
jgi:RNA polymerase sigma factor (sigma-70 family)